MYPLTSVATSFNKESIDEINNTFEQTSPTYPLTNLATSFNKESIDEISNIF